MRRRVKRICGVPPKRAVAFAGLVLSVTLLVGCTGDGQVGAFERAFAGDTAIASMDLTSHDNQPFTGGVSGEVYARDGLADSEVADLAHRLSAYAREHGDQMQGLVTLVADGFEMVVSGDDTTDAAAARTLLVLRSDDRVRSGQIESHSITIVAANIDAALSVLRNPPVLLNDQASENRETFVRTEDRALDLEGEPSQLAAALEGWDALSGEIALEGMRLRDGRLVVTLERERDFARAQQAAASLTAQSGLTLVFASDLIRLGESEGSRARELLSRLDAELASRVAWVWESGTRLQIAVNNEEDLGVVAAGLSGELPVGTTDATLEIEGVADSRIDLPL